MENQSNGKAKTQPGTAKKLTTRTGKTTTNRTKTRPVDSGQIYVVLDSVVNADSMPATGLTIIT